MTDSKRDAPLPVAAELGVHAEQTQTQTAAEQGPPPADHASRPASGVEVTPHDGLSAAEVAAMTGGSEDSTDANIALEEAAGIDPSA